MALLVIFFDVRSISTRYARQVWIRYLKEPKRRVFAPLNGRLIWLIDDEVITRRTKLEISEPLHFTLLKKTIQSYIETYEWNLRALLPKSRSKSLWLGNDGL